MVLCLKSLSLCTPYNILLNVLRNVTSTNPFLWTALCSFGDCDTESQKSMYEPKSSLARQKPPGQRGNLWGDWVSEDHRFHLGSFWLAQFMETAGAPGRFYWVSQEFWAVKQHYLTIPQRGTVNPWTERKTRSTRWSSWLTCWKPIRWVSVCERF